MSERNAFVRGAFAFVIRLMSQCLYGIGALCPRCVLVWAAALPLWWYVTPHAPRTGVLPASRGPVAGAPRVGRPRPGVRRGPALVLAGFGARLF
ncbi:hypothetical protein [Streptomyces beihaiensis]|uniref:Uncharacterized protein n=1 Tax=Streptomyces beihaiensis TaxID=2984495 RepID=A0ABT3TMJ1_9ACTN|nr:hypothetical protein [Streptomyces beihaiensis]MCX3058259.1 hypothetical protein [Streptomyces beihaiensis]